MKKMRQANQFIKSPQYRGGLTAMRKFIAKNLVYPKAAEVEKVNGSVYIRYEINNKGTVSDTKVISGLGFGCDEEAERVVRLLEFDVEKVRKLRVTHHKKIRVWFRYKEEKVKKSIKQTSSSVQYSIKKKSTTSSNNSKSSRSYSYTIKLN